MGFDYSHGVKLINNRPERIHIATYRKDTDEKQVPLCRRPAMDLLCKQRETGQPDLATHLHYIADKQALVQCKLHQGIPT